MRVVLLETIEGLGMAGQEVKVKDGYARNYLIPKGKALLATDCMIKSFNDKIQAGIRAEAKTKEHALKLAEELMGVVLTFKAKAGEDGKLFGSVTSAQIQETLMEKGFDVDKKRIALSEPIRHLGTHEVVVRLYPEVSATLKVEVGMEEE
jgi:large subunit ribosomal protein L9